MAKLANLARMTTATTGAGAITLGSAVSGYLTFAQAGISNGDVVSYAINEGNNSETGTGTYSSTGPTLTRNVVNSTNSNAAIALAGIAEVFISPLAIDIVSDINALAQDPAPDIVADFLLAYDTSAAAPKKVKATDLAKGFSAHKNGTNQSGVADSTPTKLTFTTELFDVGGYYDAANSRWTPPAGLVMLTAQARCFPGPVDGGDVIVALNKNGTLFRRGYDFAAKAGDAVANFCVLDQANGTDYYEASITVASGGASITVSGSDLNTYFMGAML